MIVATYFIRFMYIMQNFFTIKLFADQNRVFMLIFQKSVCALVAVKSVQNCLDLNFVDIKWCCIIFFNFSYLPLFHFSLNQILLRTSIFMKNAFSLTNNNNLYCSCENFPYFLKDPQIHTTRTSTTIIAHSSLICRTKVFLKVESARDGDDVHVHHNCLPSSISTRTEHFTKINARIVAYYYDLRISDTHKKIDAGISDEIL